MFSASENSSVKTALVVPPMIYGLGRGPVNQRSIQIPSLVNATLKRQRGLQVGPGESRWGNIHVADLSRIFQRLVDKAVEGNEDSSTWGAKGLYFTGVGELSFGEISRRVAAAAHDLHLIPSREVDQIGGDEADELLPHGSVLFGTNARSGAQRAEKVLRWQPENDSLELEIPRVVAREAQSLGLQAEGPVCKLDRFSLYGKYKQSLELQHLEAAVEATHKAVEVATRASDLAYFLDLLGELMLERFWRTGSDDDLEASVKFATKALASIPENDPMWPGIANNLALKLRQRSRKTSSTMDLEKGIQLCKRALSLPTQYVHFRQRLLSTLGILLGLLFRRRGDMDDLQEAIQISRKTITLADPETDNKAIEYNNLGNRLENLHDWTGNPDHLNEAIQCAREAV
uniref:WGS project CBMI000000000 data, contig CS3069_c001800 n=1 Tax=Fusarium clavum TaxID=2594811 RepID=A0A090N5K1_9HYPO|nr:unnamed protein product [Fusarium clavum]